MSKALKCDRCFKCFDPMRVKDDKFFGTIYGAVIQNSNQFRQNVRGEVPWEEGDPLHLCPTCAGYFMKFMNREPFRSSLSPIKEVVHLDEKERKMYYEQGIKDGVAAYSDLLFGPDSIFEPCGDCDGDDENNSPRNSSKRTRGPKEEGFS